MAYINTITWESTKQPVSYLNIKTPLAQTNFILFYSQNGIYNPKYGDEVREGWEAVEIGKFVFQNQHRGRDLVPKRDERIYLGVQTETYWMYKDETMKKLISEGLIKKNDKGRLKVFRKRVGKNVTNLWKTEKDKAAYPTQKPYKLLERIILLSTV